MRQKPVLPVDRPLAILLMEAGAVADEKLRATLGESGLKPRHCQLLMRLVQDGATSQQDLLDALDLDASVLVGLLNDLEGEGLVERVRDPADRRRHIVDVSDLGTKTLMKLNAEIDDLSRQLFGAISATDIETLRRSLSAVCTNDRDGSNTGCA
jgi:DNA-binding MarR family transcriptional regulator